MANSIVIVLTVFAVRIILDLKGDRQRHTSNTVNVKKQKQTVNKNIVHLFMEGAMPDSLHKSESKNVNNGDQNCCKPLPAGEESLASTNFNKCPVKGTVDDNVNSNILYVDKYSLEMNTACKSDHLRLARGARGNKNFMAQSKQFFYFISIYGLHSRIMKYYVRMVGTIMRDYKYLSIHS